MENIGWEAKLDLYLIYRRNCLIIGFLLGYGFIKSFVTSKPVVDAKMLLGTSLLLLACIAPLITRELTVLGIRRREVIMRTGWRTVTIPTEAIRRFACVSNAVTSVVSVSYLKDGNPRTVEYDVLGYNRKSITTLIGRMRELRPDLEIIIDSGFQRFIDQGRNWERRMPSTPRGWLLFLVQWVLIAFTVTSVFMYALRG